MADSLRQIAEIQEERQDFVAARKAWQESLRIETKLHGARHWRQTDGRWALKRLARLTALNPSWLLLTSVGGARG